MSYKQRLNNPIYKTNTLLVTEECNLRCKYCYEEDKQKYIMPIDVAKKAVDYFKATDSPMYQKTIWEFIGGEPLMEIELVDEITEYIKAQYPEGNFIISITTNGTLLDNQKVRKYLQKDICKKSVGLSLDGPKHVHNLNRGNSYDAVMANFDWWRKTYPWCTTKSTVNRETLPYLAETIKFLVELGLEQIPINLIYEEDWNYQDAEVYLGQLVKAADFMVDSGKYEKSHVFLFNESYINPPKEKRNWCGAGLHMSSVDHNGNIYPCMRFCTERNFPPIGTIHDGIDERRLFPFKLSHLKQNECGECPSLSSCPGCLAWDYTSTGTIFNKATNMCIMHRVLVEANRYFFNRIARLGS